MLKLVLIARLSDRLPLTSSTEMDGRKLDKYKQKQKQLLIKLSSNPNPARKMTVSLSSDHEIHILTEGNVCYMTLCEKSYKTDLAYSFLDELKKEFIQVYGGQIEKPVKPYPFLQFDKFIQRTRKVYMDTRTKNNLTEIKDDLNDVKQIMRKNFEEVVHRDQKLETMTKMSESILDVAKNLKSNSHSLNRLYWIKTYGPAIAVVSIVLLVIFIRYFIF